MGISLSPPLRWVDVHPKDRCESNAWVDVSPEAAGWYDDEPRCGAAVYNDYQRGWYQCTSRAPTGMCAHHGGPPRKPRTAAQIAASESKARHAARRRMERDASALQFGLYRQPLSRSVVLFIIDMLEPLASVSHPEHGTPHPT